MLFFQKRYHKGTGAFLVVTLPVTRPAPPGDVDIPSVPSVPSLLGGGDTDAEEDDDDEEDGDDDEDDDTGDGLRPSRAVDR